MEHAESLSLSTLATELEQFLPVKKEAVEQYN